MNLKTGVGRHPDDVVSMTILEGFEVEPHGNVGRDRRREAVPCVNDHDRRDALFDPYEVALDDAADRRHEMQRIPLARLDDHDHVRYLLGRRAPPRRAGACLRALGKGYLLSCQA